MDHAITSTRRKSALSVGTLGAACLLATPALAAPPGPAGAGTGVQQIVPVQIWWGGSVRGTDGTPVDWSGSVRTDDLALSLQGADDFEADERATDPSRNELTWTATSDGGKDGLRFDVVTYDGGPGQGELQVDVGDVQVSVAINKLGCEPIVFPHPTVTNQMLWISRQCHARSVSPAFGLTVLNGTRGTMLTVHGGRFGDAANAGLSVVRGINTGSRKATFALEADEVAFAPFAELCVQEGRLGECIPFTELVCGSRLIPMRGRLLRVTGECPADPGRLGVFFPNPDVYPDPDAYPTYEDFSDPDQFATPWTYTNPDAYPFDESLPSPEG